MNALTNLYQAHPALVTLGSYYVLSAAIGSMPSPDKDSHKFYRWFFQFSNTLGANLARALSSRLPKDIPPEPPKGT